MNHKLRWPIRMYNEQIVYWLTNRILHTKTKLFIRHGHSTSSSCAWIRRKEAKKTHGGLSKRYAEIKTKRIERTMLVLWLNSFVAIYFLQPQERIILQMVCIRVFNSTSSSILFFTFFAHFFFNLEFRLARLCFYVYLDYDDNDDDCRQLPSSYLYI